MAIKPREMCRDDDVASRHVSVPPHKPPSASLIHAMLESEATHETPQGTRIAVPAPRQKTSLLVLYSGEGARVNYESWPLGCEYETAVSSPLLGVMRRGGIHACVT